MPTSREIKYQLHPLRDALYNELHIRPFNDLGTPQLVTHMAAIAQQPELAKSFDLICDLCRRYGVNTPQAGAVAYHQDFGKFTIHWERHVEFYTLTIMQPTPVAEQPFVHTAIDLLPADWVKALPGQMVSAFHIVVDDQQLNYQGDAISRYFEGHQVIVSEAKKGKAELYTAFKLHGDGYGRFIIRNTNLSATQMGQLSRRLMEMETYRLLALLSLPIAKRIAPQLVEMDHQLAEILTVVTNLDSSRAERELLEKLTGIEAKLEKHRAETNRRFSATRAYHDLVKDRLNGMGEAAVNGHLSMGEFMSRRLDPALRTCESLQKWMEDLSKRIERASDLLRTRVNLNVQDQNRSLLSAMNKRSELQFRLQETVEGLSIAAISYYLVGLISYLLNGLPLENWGLDKKVLLACSIPLVLLTVGLVTHRIKHRLIKSPQQE
ncbi:MAG TPA: DUF3422 domain-containing protein [Malonomonas sp.]